MSLGRAARLILAACLIVFGLLAFVWSWGPLQNVFDDYRDNTVGDYVFLASIFWAIGAAAFVVAAVLIQSARRSP